LARQTGLEQLGASLPEGERPLGLQRLLIVVSTCVLVTGCDQKSESTNAAQQAITGSADALSSATPPESFRDIEWDSELPSIAQLRGTAMKGCAFINEQTNFETTSPCSHMHIDTDDIESFDQHENVPPFLGAAVSEQMLTWSHQKFWSGEVFLQNASEFSKVRQQLIATYGSPTFENSSLHVTKWRWSTSDRQLSIQLYTDDHGIVSLLFTQDD
jgi:hypothetical protein